MSSAFAAELITEVKAAGLDPDVSLGDVATAPAVTTSDEVIAKFSGSDPAPAAPAATPEPEAVAPEPSAPAQTPATHASFLEAYKDDPEFQAELAQVQTKYGNDREALRGLLHARKLVGERNDLAQVGKTLVENPQAALAWIAQNHPHLLPQPEPPKEEPKPSTNGEAHWKPSWNKYIDRGRLVDDAPESVREDITTYLRERSLLESPTYQKVTKELDAVKQQLAQFQQQPQMDPRDYVNAAIAQVESTRNAQDFIKANSDWLFEKGTQTLSTSGRTFNVALQEALQGGAQSDIAIKYAMSVVNQAKLPSAKPSKTPNKQTQAHQPSTATVSPEAADVPWDDSLGLAGNAKNLAKTLGLDLSKLELTY